MLTTPLMYLQHNSNSTSGRMDNHRLNSYSKQNPRSNTREKYNQQEDHLDTNVAIPLASFAFAPKKNNHVIHTPSTPSSSVSQTSKCRNSSSSSSGISYLFSKKCALNVISNDDNDINNNNDKNSKKRKNKNNKNKNKNKNKNNHNQNNNTNIEHESNQSRENSTHRYNLIVNNELKYENENSYSNREDKEYLENIPEINEINTNIPEDSFSIQADMKTPTPTDTKETTSLSTEEDQIPLVSIEERDLSIIRTKSGKHIFEPAFYQAQYLNGRPEYQRRYLYEKTLGNTLQGYICMAKDRVGNGKVAIKVANKTHITKRMSTTGTYIAEDFINEIGILKKISTRNPLHNGFAKWIDEWETTEQRYLAIEYCAGGDLFNFTQQVLHRYPSLKPKINTSEARTQLMQNSTVYPRFVLIQDIFAQMVSVVAYLHNEMQMCHMDISLENFMIANEDTELKPIVKLIDFGVALDFSDKEGPSKFMYSKSVGKLKYQSPECYDCRHQELQRFYDCRLNDNYCLGVCLFMLLFAQHPYERPSSRSDYYCMKLLEQGVMPFLESHQYQYLVNKETVHLLSRLLTPEPKRYFAEQIIRHPFFNRTATIKRSPMKK